MHNLSYLIVLRLIHITCAIFWAGATIYLASFVGPAVKASGPEGTKFMQQLAKTNKLPLVMTLAATLAVVAGLLLFWELSDGFQSAWIKTNHGMVLSIGGGLAIIAYLEGLFVTRPTVDKINKLGKAIAMAGAPPSEEQAQQLMKLRKKIFAANIFVAALLTITVIAMSLVRYI